MTTAVLTSVLVGLGVGVAHYAGHVLGGSKDAFDDAGVKVAGIAVVFAASVATYIVLSAVGGA